MSLPEYWAVCIREGLMGFACAHCQHEAGEIATTMLTLLDIPPQTVWLFSIGPRLFTTKDRIIAGDA